MIFERDTVYVTAIGFPAFPALQQSASAHFFSKLLPETIISQPWKTLKKFRENFPARKSRAGKRREKKPLRFVKSLDALVGHVDVEL
jgi:hypothetical protein